MVDWSTLMTLPLSDVQRPMGSKFTDCFIVSMSSRDFGWGVSEQLQQQEQQEQQREEKHDFKGKTIKQAEHLVGLALKTHWA